MSRYRLKYLVRRSVGVLVTLLRTVAFWTAVVFPLVYGVILFMTPSWTGATRLFVVGVAIHLLAFVFGHGYNRPEMGHYTP